MMYQLQNFIGVVLCENSEEYFVPYLQWVADGRGRLQIWRVVANVLNK
jgi:hypothetical protein